MNKKRLFFSREGVDINDDDALAAFATQVWEQATAAFAEEQDNAELRKAPLTRSLSASYFVS